MAKSGASAPKKHLHPALEANKWSKGQSGNPKGREKGSRNKLTELFLARLAADFEAHGESAIVEMRETKPAEYVRVVASLLPKQAELEVNANDAFIDLWRLVSAGRAAEALMQAEAERDGETIQ